MNEQEEITVITLIITDGIFGNQCADCADYVQRLKTVLGNKPGRVSKLVSVVGSRGICDLDNTIEALDLDTKNKTQFVQSLENNITLFDEILIIKDADDLFLSGARQIATELSKPLYTYGYPRKTK